MPISMDERMRIQRLRTLQGFSSPETRWKEWDYAWTVVFFIGIIIGLVLPRVYFSYFQYPQDKLNVYSSWPASAHMTYGRPRHGQLLYM